MSLSEKQMRAAFLLAQGMQTKEVADKLEVTSATICNWKKLSNFQIERNKYLKQIFDDSLESLLRLNAEAITALGSILSGTNSERVKLQAIQLIFAATGLTAQYSADSFYRLSSAIGPCSEVDAYIRDRSTYLL